MTPNIYPVSKYKNWLVANSYAESSISLYICFVKKFLAYLSDREITEDIIVDYILKLKSKYAVKSVNSHLDAINSFLKFLKLDINTPKTSKTIRKIPKYITYEFLRDSIIPMVDLISKHPFRDKTLLYFLFFTGLRKGEIYSLERKNFDLDKRTVKVYKQKTKEERIICYTRKVRDMIRAYFMLEPENKNAFNIGKNTISGLLKRLNLYFKDINLHPHLFRDSYCVHLLKKGIDISIVSGLVGHNSINTTMKYARLNTDDLKRKYDEFIK